MICFTVYGDPVAQGRPRFTTAGGRPRAYDPQKSNDYKDYVKLVASQHAPPAPLDTALMMTVTVYRPIPKNFSKKKVEAAERGEILPTTKPDIDNYVKGIKDALKGIIWADDSLVTDVTAGKRYSVKPRIEITVVEV